MIPVPFMYDMHYVSLVSILKESEGEGTGPRARGNPLRNQYLSETGVIAALWCDLLRYQRLITMPLSQFILFIFMSLQRIRHGACCSWGKGWGSPERCAHHGPLLGRGRGGLELRASSPGCHRNISNLRGLRF